MFAQNFNEEYQKKLSTMCDYKVGEMYNRFYSAWNDWQKGHENLTEEFMEFINWWIEDYVSKDLGLEMVKQIGFAIRDGEF